ncbi:MAG: hypothetical protein WCY51_07480 [Sulfurimonas sp.]|uniref:hypothetical protein n=1 Tax=Sulfurimonas sp. TaxID=2022749 RepID=UPI0025DBD2FA|nr:hypothetical protein [Sulfurimonas sp.]MCK9455531.1 hypothetical protein [Sulfurimonas sp.]
MTKFIVASTILTIIFSGCTAKIEHMPGSIEKSKYAPINSEEQYGLVSYLNGGASSVREARREDAYKKMYEACSGKYKIIDESNKNSGAMFISNGNGGGFMANTNKIYIKFICVK